MSDRSSAFKVNFDADAPFAPGTGKTSFVRLARDLRPFYIKIFLFAAVSILFAVTFVKIPVYLGQIADIFISAVISSVIKGKNDFDASALAQIIPPVIAVFAANTVFAVLKGVLSTDISSGYSDHLRKRVFAKTGTVPAAYFDITSKKYIHTVSTEMTDAVSQSLNLLLSDFFGSCALIAAVLLTIIRKDPAVGIVSAGFIILQPLAGYLLRAPRRRSAETTEQSAPVFDIRELYDDLGTVRLSGRASELSENMIATNDRLTGKKQRERFTDFVESSFSSLLTGILLAVTVILEYGKISSSAITLGTLLSLLIFLLKLSGPVSHLSSFPRTAGMLLSASDAVFDYLSAPDENSGTKTEDLPADGDIDIRGITFRYASGGRPVLDGFSSVIGKRGMTVISGATGNGKTTLMKLVLGFYKPESGGIFYGGKNIAALDVIRYRSLFSVITQNETLFQKSIRENICYPDEKAEEEKLLSAAERAGALGFIEKLENGPDTVFSQRPQNLSDGQVQLILLARALYHEKKFIVLDEATSFIDNAGEKEVYEVLKKIAESRSVTVITHRCIGRRYADNIIEIE